VAQLDLSFCAFFFGTYFSAKHPTGRRERQALFETKLMLNGVIGPGPVKETETQEKSGSGDALCKRQHVEQKGFNVIRNGGAVTRLLRMRVGPEYCCHIAWSSAPAPSDWRGSGLLTSAGEGSI
jgi:hypothetical protein